MTIDQATIGLAIAAAANAVLIGLALTLTRRHLNDATAFLAQARHIHGQAVAHHKRSLRSLDAQIAEIGHVLNLYRHELALTPRADDIVRLLADLGSLTAPEIAGHLHLDAHAVAERLAIAERQHGLVEWTLQGGEFVYSHVSRFARDVTQTTDLDFDTVMAAA